MDGGAGGQEESNVIPVIAPQLRVDPSRVEDLQLCYAVQVPDGKYGLQILKSTYTLVP